MKSEQESNYDFEDFGWDTIVVLADHLEEIVNCGEYPVTDFEKTIHASSFWLDREDKTITFRLPEGMLMMKIGVQFG